MTCLKTVRKICGTVGSLFAVFGALLADSNFVLAMLLCSSGLAYLMLDLLVLNKIEKASWWTD